MLDGVKPIKDSSYDTSKQRYWVVLRGGAATVLLIRTPILIDG